MLQRTTGGEGGSPKPRMVALSLKVGSTGNDRMGSGREVVHGAANMGDCEQVRLLLTRVRRALRRRPGTLVIDLQDVVKADTKLIAGMVASLQLAHEAGVAMELWLSAAILDLLDVCRLGEVFGGA